LLLAISVPAYRLVSKDVDYRLGKEIAKGGTSRIYLADILDPQISQSNPSRWGSVVKIIHESQELQQDDVFNQEVAIMADLSEHPNFIKVPLYVFVDLFLCVAARIFQLAKVHSDALLQVRIAQRTDIQEEF
jgi:hypothetical protein